MTVDPGSSRQTLTGPTRKFALLEFVPRVPFFVKIWKVDFETRMMCCTPVLRTFLRPRRPNFALKLAFSFFPNPSFPTVLFLPEGS